MFKNFLVKKMLKSQGASDEQAELIIKIMEKNPSLFQQIATEIKTKVDGGMSQQEAAMQVMMAHEAELKQLAQN
jgi:methyl coenzyme M reductase alpha subunit